MNGYLLLAIELAAILVVCVGLALFLGWVLGKRSARAKLAAEQDSSQTPATDALKTSRVEEKKEPTPLTSRDRADITCHHAAPLPDRGFRIRSAAAGVEPIALCAQPVAHG